MVASHLDFPRASKQREPGIFLIAFLKGSKIVLVAAQLNLFAPEGDAGVGRHPPDDERPIQPQRSKD